MKIGTRTKQTSEATGSETGVISPDDERVSNNETERTTAESAAANGDRLLAEREAVDGYPAESRLSRLERTSADLDGGRRAGERPAVDAWFAAFGSPALGALLSATDSLLRRDAATAEAWEVVIGTDDRVRINPQPYPWRSICSLLITAADGSSWVGTGWLAGPRTVITAGHCVYIHQRGGWVRQIEVIPGRDGSNRPFGTQVSRAFRSVRGWTERRLRETDYGAIILPPDAPFGGGARNGSFGYEVVPEAQLRGLLVNIAGYPGDKTPRGTQWFHSRDVLEADERTFVYDADTAPGQSGAPVWRLADGRRYVIGIHTNGEQSGNSATRIVDAVYDNISAWVDEA
jgi:glutamyl endopeptidase